MTDPNAQQPQPEASPPVQQPSYPPAQPAYPPVQSGYPQAGYPQPGYPQSYGQPAYVVGDFPGKTLGIVGLVFAFRGWLAVVGLILSIVAQSQSKNAGFQNTPAKVGIIVGAIMIGLALIATITIVAIALTTAAGAEYFVLNGS